MKYNLVHSLKMNNGILTAFMQGVEYLNGTKKDIGEEVKVQYKIVEHKTIRVVAGFKNIILKSSDAEYYDYPPDRVKSSGSIDEVKHVSIYIDLEHVKVFLTEYNVYFWLRQEIPRECDLEMSHISIEDGILAKPLVTNNFTSIFEAKSFGQPIKGYEDIWEECKKFQNIAQ